ncbi:MAG TPA: hypothetical protein VMF30_09005 [Pirellulales bacterium]|nr:hypothetical protein [Pirellulales bacterium]
MRFCYDVTRRLSIGVLLAVVGSLAGSAAAQAQATPPATGQPGQSQPSATQRLPQATRSVAPIGGRPQTQRQPTTANPSVASKPGQPAGAVPVPPAGPPPTGPTPPFLLNSREQELLDKFLVRWEQQNSKTKTFKCKFKRREFDQALTDDKAKNHLRSEGTGEVKYKQPDHGIFEVQKETEFNENQHKYEQKTDGLDHWVCDGIAIYEFVPADKKLKVHPLPKEMQGEAIADGPIPFIFGAKVEKMKQRYWIRDITPKEEVGQRVWMEVFPKYQHDAANFSSAVLVLNDADLSLYGLEITQAGGVQRSQYVFSDVIINDSWEILKRDFKEPRTPTGWTKEVDPPPDANPQPVQQSPQQTAAPTATARQTKPATPAAPSKR